MRYARPTSLGLVAGMLLAVGSGHGDEKKENLVPAKTVRELLERKRPQAFVPGEVIVKRRMVAGVAREVSPDRMKQMGLAPDPRVTSGAELVYRLAPGVMAPLSARAAVDRTLAAVESLKGLAEVEYAQPNYILHIESTSPNDPDYRRQWHYFTNGTGADRSPGGINLPLAWDTNKGSTGVVVAVIDTGILPNHPDITGSPNLVPGYDMISNVRTANDGNGRDPDPTDPGDAVTAGECGPGSPTLPSSWHGTHVAGTVGVGNTNNGRGVAGVNWTVKLQAVRVLGKCGGTIEDINDAIRWAAGLPVPGVPTNATPAKVINMSLGGGGACSLSPATQSAIDDAVSAGTTVVVAAGNEASDASGFMPASCEKVITVAAGDFRGRLVERYSNFGPAVEILAPGGDVDRDDDRDGNEDGVYSMVNGGYAYYNGTSMASPHVAGVAALMLAANPSASPAQVLARLQQTAIPRSTVECARPCGAGLLNAFESFLSIGLSPSEIRLGGSGETATLTATVTRGAAPVAGATVALKSDNTGVATVTPPSAVTDAAGQVKAEVKGGSNGNANVSAETQGTSNAVPVRVPSLSEAGFVLLAVLASVLFYRRTHRSGSGQG